MARAAAPYGVAGPATTSFVHFAMCCVVKMAEPGVGVGEALRAPGLSGCAGGSIVLALSRDRLAKRMQHGLDALLGG